MSLLLGIVAGTIVGCGLHMVDFTSIAQAEVFQPVKPFYYGMPESLNMADFYYEYFLHHQHDPVYRSLFLYG